MMFNLIWLLGFFMTGECGGFVQTLVGDKLTLVSEEKCLNISKGSLVYLTARPPQDVAKLKDGRWSPMSDYETRFTPGGVVEFKKATINDNGVYELSCGSKTNIQFQVEVLVPYDLQASVGESVKLPCYFKTKTQPVDSVRWDQGKNEVLEYCFKSKNKTDGGNGFTDRVSVSQDAHSSGDLSLSLRSVQIQDQGQFYCKLWVSGQGEDNGLPAVVRLWVRNSSTTGLHMMWLVIALLCCLISIFVTKKFC